MTIKEIEEVCIKLQMNLELINSGNPAGSCYLTGPLLSEYFMGLNIDSRPVYGHFKVLNNKNKFILYSNKNLNNPLNLGYFHTWCEVKIDGYNYIVDPSIKFNKAFLKRYGHKISKQIPNSIITNLKKCYYWEYKEDYELFEISNRLLSDISPITYQKLLQRLHEA